MPSGKIDHRGRLSKGLNSSRDLTPRDYSGGFIKDLYKSIAPFDNKLKFPKESGVKNYTLPKREKPKKARKANQAIKKSKTEKTNPQIFTKHEVNLLIRKFFRDYKV